MSLITQEHRAKATELYHGNEVCKAQFKRLLREVHMPNGLLPLEDVEECGFIESSPTSGFVWVKQKKEIKHKFEKIGRLVSYGTEVTAYVERCKIKKLTGVKAKELLIWLTINEITVDSPESDKIVFKTTTGLSRTFPTDAFKVPEEVVKEKKEIEGTAADDVKGKGASVGAVKVMVKEV